MHIRITLAQADVLSAHIGASEYLDAALDAGMALEGTALIVPPDALSPLLAFTSMRAEIYRDNHLDPHEWRMIPADDRRFLRAGATLDHALKGFAARG